MNVDEPCFHPCTYNRLVMRGWLLHGKEGHVAKIGSEESLPWRSKLQSTLYKC